MIKIDLITGFLGAGKTTFIKKYAKYLMDQGEYIGIIENDFGAINVDMLLLQDLEGDLCDVEPIVGGNVVSDWKRRFKAKLISLAMQGVKRVLVEPSGIYDVNAFFEVLYEEPVDQWYEVGNIITVVDANVDQKLSEQAEFLLMSQVADSGLVVFSKVDSATDEQLQSSVSYITDLLKKYECDHEIKGQILAKDWDRLDDDDYKTIMNAGWFSATYQKLYFDKNDVFTSLFFMNIKMDQNQIQARMEKLIKDPAYGTIFRIKGFFQIDDDKWIEINATKEHFQMNQIKKGQEVVIVIGENLNQEAISRYLSE